uniref:Nucleolar pre-ribosomal-associated protein 1 n=1 Tax=Phallusia mammillata TaxID=59560 RepID=A0A6F9DWI2_9ASCI|nr:nucleolar pre-ribosomal-associated protein 1 [Phallusia mammillata]
MSFVLQVLTTLFEKLNSVVSLDDDLIQAWNQFVKSALKYQIASSEVCDFLRQRICKFNIENTHKLLQPTTIFKMLTSHSSFLEVALSGNSEFSQAKTSLMQLLHSLVQRCDTSALQTADYHYLLAAYHATLSDADQCILQILLLYEANGVSTADCSPFLWGNTAVESYQARKNMGETLYRNPAPNKVLSCIDSEIMNNTLREFPIRRRLITLQQLREEPTKNQHYIEEVSDLRLTPRYDPQFLLSVFSTMLVPENLVDCRSFLRQGALSFLLLSLSSHCPMIRNLAAGCLARYYDLAEPLWFSEKNLTLYLLRCVRNAAQIEKGSFKKISTIMALYLSKMAEIMMQPAEHIYFALNRFLLVKPGLDLRHVPEFYVLFFSTDMEYKTERSWMLDLMAQGTRDMGDYHVTQSRQLLRILMTYYASPTSDNKTRAQVLQVLERCCAIRGAAFDLIFNHGLLPWLLNVVTQQNDSTATRDGGSDVSKRQDPTSGVVAIFKSLWCALDPERTHNVALVDEKQTPDTGISRSGNIPSVVSHSEEVEDIVADEQEEVSTIGVTRDFPKRFTPVSLRLARQLTNLSLELLSNLLRVSGADSAEFKRFDLSSDAVKPFIDVLHVLTLMFAYLRDKYGDDVIGSDVRISDRQAKVLFHVGELLEHNHADGIINCALVLLCWKHVGRSCLSTNPLQIITWTMRTIVTSQYIGKILGESVLWFKNWIKVLGETKDEPLADDHKVAVQRLLLQVSEFLCFNSSDITNFEDLYMLLLEATKCVGNLPVPAMPENETFRHLALSVTLDNQRKHLMSECLKSSHL